MKFTLRAAVPMFALGLVLAGSASFAQNLASLKGTNKKGGGYQFTIDKDLAAQPVKNQAKTNTCWSFSGQSLLESELARMGKGNHSLSVMFVVRKAYEMKADKYVRMNGKINFAEGGEYHDVLNVLAQYGAVPEEAYPGGANLYGEGNHAHFELEAVLKGFLDGLIKNKNGRISTAWKTAFNGILDAYLGKVPEQFSYKGKSYTPKTFASAMGLDANNYITLTSFSHHPFNRQIMVEVSDNWAGDRAWNLPLAEFTKSIEQAVSQGYSVAWATDVSEKYFSHQSGVAVVPDADLRNLTDAEVKAFLDGPVKQKTITQELRQAAFDSQETTDDHGMHIIGSAKDQLGTRYYIVKNSWGTERNDLGGIFYASQPYVQYKTTFVTFHKSALPADVAKQLGISIK